jgi:hypothetical protein
MAGCNMTGGLPIPVSCCGCGRQSCKRADLQTLWEEVLSVLGWYPWRCTVCGALFYLRRKINDPYLRLDPRVKQKNAEREAFGDP